MKLQAIQGFLALLLIAVARASHVAYSIGSGLRPDYYVSVGLTLRNPAAYTFINDPSVVALSQLVLGDVYDIASDAWMFPPQTTYFQYHSAPASTYVTVGALLMYDNIGDLSDVVSVCDAIASHFGISFLGQLAGIVTKRDLAVAESELLDVLLTGRKEDVVGILSRRGGTCALGQDLSPYVTDDTEQTSDTIGSYST